MWLLATQAATHAALATTFEDEMDNAEHETKEHGKNLLNEIGRRLIKG